MQTRKWEASRLTIIGILLMSASMGWAGVLDNFEAGANRPPGRPPPGHRPPRDYGGWGAEYFWAQVLADIAFYGLVYGGAESLNRVAPGSQELEDEVEPRQTGEPLIPYGRFDASYQRVSDKIDALGFRGEGGYGPIGAHMSYCVFHHEDSAAEETDHAADRLADTREVREVFGLYRMSFGSRAEIDLGFGSLRLTGRDDDTTQPAWTLPMHFRPADFLAIDFVPVWTDTIGDYDLGLLFFWRYVFLKAGYRWLVRPAESLEGPYGGVTICF